MARLHWRHRRLRNLTDTQSRPYGRFFGRHHSPESKMTVTNSEAGVLNFYRASQLHSGLILGQMGRRTNDARLILIVRRHSEEEVMHAQLWTDTIIAQG